MALQMSPVVSSSSSGGGGGGGIGGTISVSQIAVGSAADEISGSSYFTLTNNTLQLGSGNNPGTSQRSILVGDSNVISGGNEVASFGSSNTNGYFWTFTAGYGNQALWQSSAAIGQSNTVGTGCGASVAMGQNCSITSGSSGRVALGNSAVLSNDALFSIGDTTNASSAGSAAMGNRMTVSGQNSFGYNHGTTTATLAEDYVHGIYHADHLIKKHNNFAGSGKYETTAAVETDDNTITNLYTKTLSDNTVYYYHIDIVARRSDSGTENGRFTREFLVYRQGAGAATLGASTVTPWTDEQLTMAGTITVDVNVNDIRVRVTGENTKTIQWAATIRYQAVSGSA